MEGMAWLSRVSSGLRALVWKDRTERELDQELRGYLEMAVERNVAAGMEPAEARRAALAELGSIEAVKDHVRDVGWETQLESFGRDLRYAIRSFVHSPRFTIPALLTLAIGIGATAAVFSVMRTVLFEPLPYPEPDRIVAVWETTRGGASRNGIAPANFVEWRERARTLEHLGMAGPRGAVMLVNGQPLQLPGMAVSSDVFRALGVQPALGRAYTAEEDAGSQVVVLSHEFWQRAFGGRPDVLGLPVTTDGDRRTVVGVMPPQFTIAGQQADFFMPYGATVEQLRAARGRGASYAVGRLRDGTSFDDAVAEMRAIYAALEKEQPQRNAGRTVMLFPLAEQMVGEVRPALLTLMAAVALVLIVASVNVANLLLARSAARVREVGMRTALGASRGRLIRQMLTESLVLATAGGAAGLGVAAMLHRGLVSLLGDRIVIPRLDQVALDLRVVVFTMLVALATGVAFGLAPALISVGAANEALRESGRVAGGRRLRRVLNALVVAEVALSLMLLVGGGLLMRSFVNQRRVDTGYRSEGVLTTRVQLPGARYDEKKAAALFMDVLPRLAALPGVRQSAAASCLPTSGCAATSVWRLDRTPPPDGQRSSSQIRPVSPAFFRTMAMAQVAGRDFTDADTADSTAVAIISETMAREDFSGEDPIGRQLHVNSINHANGSADMPWTIVGVVRDVRSPVDGTASRVVYVPLTQMPGRSAAFFVRAAGDPTTVAASATRLVQAMEPEAPVTTGTFDEIVAGTIARQRALTTLVAAFAVVTLALAALGLYGIIAYSVRERMQEMAVRLALGATAGALRRLLVGQALKLAAMGVVSGLVAAGALTRLLERLLFAVDPLDPWTFGSAALMLLAVAAVAAYLPARRGTRAAPAAVLRAG